MSSRVVFFSSVRTEYCNWGTQFKVVRSAKVSHRRHFIHGFYLLGLVLISLIDRPLRGGKSAEVPDTRQKHGIEPFEIGSGYLLF